MITFVFLSLGICKHTIFNLINFPELHQIILLILPNWFSCQLQPFTVHFNSHLSIVTFNWQSQLLIIILNCQTQLSSQLIGLTSQYYILSPVHKTAMN